jgi:hypothetical protein
MNDRGPHLKKRFYTRLMDIYRHNNIYIPGFNIITRSILRNKAESEFADIAEKALSDRSDIQTWTDQHRFFFGYGVFRSGTTFLADFLNRNAAHTIVQHEPNVNDYWFYAKAIHSKDEAMRYVNDYRLAETYYRMKDAEMKVYGEINPFLRRHCEALKGAFPTAKHFQVVRDPKDVIRSLMSRELFGRKDPMAAVIFPPENDPCRETWPTMTRFEKLCWLWAADNRFIRSHAGHLVHFEKMLSSFDHFDENVLTFLGLEVNADAWKAEVGKAFNTTPRHKFPKYSHWTPAEKQQFERICGEEMQHYRY